MRRIVRNYSFLVPPSLTRNYVFYLKAQFAKFVEECNGKKKYHGYLNLVFSMFFTFYTDTIQSPKRKGENGCVYYFCVTFCDVTYNRIFEP